MPATARFVLLLTASNVFMTIAWYGHLRYLHDRKWYVAAVLVHASGSSHTAIGEEV